MEVPLQASSPPAGSGHLGGVQAYAGPPGGALRVLLNRARVVRRHVEHSKLFLNAKIGVPEVEDQKLLST